MLNGYGYFVYDRWWLKLAPVTMMGVKIHLTLRTALDHPWWPGADCTTSVPSLIYRQWGDLYHHLSRFTLGLRLEYGWCLGDGGQWCGSVGATEDCWCPGDGGISWSSAGASQDSWCPGNRGLWRGLVGTTQNQSWHVNNTIIMNGLFKGYNSVNLFCKFPKVIDLTHMTRCIAFSLIINIVWVETVRLRTDIAVQHGTSPGIAQSSV